MKVHYILRHSRLKNGHKKVVKEKRINEGSCALTCSERLRIVLFSLLVVVLHLPN
ncbi:MAG: hypothetical protein R6V46_09865 [Desulfatiglandaceae bacterium]